MRRILVLRGGALGDFIVTLPALALLRRRWPLARLELAGNATAAQLAVNRGLLDAAHSQHEARWSALFGDEALPAEFAHWLASFDLVVNFWPDPDGDLRRRFPLHADQVFLTGDAMPGSAPASAHYAAPLQSLGLAFAGGADELWFPLSPLPPRASDRPTAPPAQRTTLCVHPGSGSARKNWPTESWLALLASLADTSPLLLILGEAELPRWSALASARFPRATTLLQPPLEEVITHLSACRLFLGHDSGISHLAAACGAPCVLLFGPTDAMTWAPPAPRVQVLQRGPDPASIPLADVRAAVTAALADRT